MSLVKSRKFDYSLLDNETPSEKLVSRGDLLVKELAEKQRSITVSLDEQLNKPKVFIKGSEIIPLSYYNAGTSSLSNVVIATEHFNAIESLKAIGLTDQDVELYLDNLNGFLFVCNKHKNWEKNLLKQHLQNLQSLVEQHNKSAECAPEQIQSKHKSVECGLTIKPNSIETRLLKFALNNSQNAIAPIPQPIDSIIEIEKDRFPNLKEESLPKVNTIRRKARKLQNRLNNLKAQDPQKTSSVTGLLSNSKWDLREREPFKQSLKTSKKKVYTCSPINYYTIKNNEIVNLNGYKEKTETECKLSLEAIKQLPKFKDYIPGSPSKEVNLKQLFKKYDCNISEYKIMHGKLRGQAFVTFLSEDRASEALTEINGSVIKNKPVVIQFSSKK
ncbi:hypothetical protein RN001_003014 [Aquatica leii]|uniref:RRM domain-containing protein n=1 Tax=Aquatica leii TaxID=1421715 RepID=A0AAN7QNU8_9COLE|nr:hypothetical protein RN001_003014 [Aquatica leii]